MAAARYLEQQRIGQDRQASTGMRAGATSRQPGEREQRPKAALRLWGLLLCLAAWALGSSAALRAQTFQTIAPLSFTKVFAGADPLPQVITVASTGDPINFSVRTVGSTGGNWLKISLPAHDEFGNFNTPDVATVSVTPVNSLPAGTYTAQIIATSGKMTMTVPVSLSIEEPSAAFFDDLPGALTFSLMRRGTAPPQQLVPIRNAGLGPLDFKASASTADGGSWIKLSASSGTAPYLLNVGIDLDDLPGGGLTSGTFTGQVLLKTGNDSVSIPVDITVADSVFRQVSSLSFTKADQGANPLPQVITFASTDLPLNFSVVTADSTGGHWLSIKLPAHDEFGNFNTPDSATVSVTDTGLLAGTYCAQITATTTDGSKSQVIPVTLNVEPPSTAFFDDLPGALTFSGPVNASLPTLPLPIRNAGKSPLNWAATPITSDQGGWLRVSQTSGTAPSDPTIEVLPAYLPGGGLLAGTFTGQILLQSAAGTVTVPVTVTIANTSFTELAPLNFEKGFEAADPAAQTLTVGSSGAPINFAISTADSTGGQWLSIRLSGHDEFGNYNTPNPVTVSVNPDFYLSPGVYTAAIYVSSTDGKEPLVIPVTLTIASKTQAAATPSFAPAGGAYASAQKVTMTTTTTGAAIYYTTDGSQPTVKSALYTAPVQVTASGTLRAIAVASGYTTSAVESASYTIAGGECVVIDNSGGFTGTGLTFNGGAAVAGKLLQLTDGGFDQARSVFSSSRVPIDSFVSDFTFQLLDAYAEGFTFAIQGDGPQALGASGGGLGYQGIANSAALKIDLFDTAGEGYDSTGIYFNGAAPTVPAIDLGQAGIDVHNGHPFAVHLAYVNGVYAGSITDTVTGVSASMYLQGYTVPAGTTAFVGFTAGSSTEGSATQNILTWKYQGGTACGH